MKKEIQIKKDPEDPIGVELLERALLDIARGMKLVELSSLTEAAIVTLIKDKTGLTKATISQVLFNYKNLDKIWLKQKEKTK